MMKNEITLSFFREEINHVKMEMTITEADRLEVQGMTEAELYEWIVSKQMEISFLDTPEAKASRFYEWRAGKEYCEGEGEKGLFDYELNEYRDGTRLESRPLGISHSVTTERAGGNDYESFVRSECICGWKGQKRSCHDNFQLHNASDDGRRHIAEVKK